MMNHDLPLPYLLIVLLMTFFELASFHTHESAWRIIVINF